MKRLILILTFSLGVNVILAQEKPLEKKLKKAFIPKVSGGINFNSSYNSNMTEANRLTYFLSGSLNLATSQFSIPISFNYSNRQFQYSQAFNFNQLSLNPTYKWARASIGTSFMNFSPYSLNGHQFFGAGVELNPETWDIKIMSGRLVRASEQDTLIGPTFNRMGYGAKIRKTLNPKLTLGTTVFYANDNESTLPVENRIFDRQVVAPLENLVVGFDAIFKPTSNLEIVLDYANSMTTTRSDTASDHKINSLAGLFLNENSTSRSYHAFKSRINLNLGQGSLLGLGYERIDPGYTTLGGYYFVNDLENITLNFSTRLFENKLQLQTSGGFQRDDLARTKSTRQQRIVGSANANYQPKKGSTINLTYTNFNSYMFIRDVYQEITLVPNAPIDSLNFSQISENLGLGYNQQIENSENVKSNFSLNVGMMRAQGRNGSLIREETKSNIYNASTNYTVSWIEQKANLGLGFAFNENNFEQGRTRGFGPTTNLQKSFGEGKLNTSLRSSYLFTSALDSQFGVYNLFLNIGYQPFKRHNLTFTAGTINNGMGVNYQNVNFGYAINF